MDRLSQIGVGERDAVGKPPRAPFDLAPPSPTATYPALRNHNAKQETQIICQPDSQLRPRIGLETKATQVWQIAGRAHLNRNFTLGSQPLAVAITLEPCIGGRAWPNVNFPKEDWDYAFSIWGNSTLGLISCWWHGSRQQPGRYRISRDSIKTLPVLDFRKLSDTQIHHAKEIFDRFKNESFQPAFRADKEKSTREKLDKAVLCEWLGFGESIYESVRGLAKKWCAEPSVHGGKQRNKNASLTT